MSSNEFLPSVPDDFIVGLPPPAPNVPLPSLADREFSRKFNQPPKKAKVDGPSEELQEKLANIARVIQQCFDAQGLV